MRIRLLIAAALCVTVVVPTTPAAQSDLDAFMARVLARRDANWKKLQQYTLTERESLQITALVVFRLFGLERQYLWFPRAGFFVRSPLSADGVAIPEQERRRAEDRWLRRAQGREIRRVEQDADDDPGSEGALTGAVNDVVEQTFEPGFIRSANFLRFRFDEGQYALVGRETMLNREALKIEYYPTLLFKDDKEQAGDDGKDAPDRFESQMEKVSQVTLWIEPTAHQILRYELTFGDLDFLPGRSLVRVGRMRATMQMGEPFENVWLPASVDMRFRMSSAAGPLEARYEVDYDDYRLPEVGVTVR